MSFNKPMDTAQARFVIELMTLAYAQMGNSLTIVDYAHPQALDAADRGVFDGQLGRIANIESKYENLLRVDYPLFKFELFMLTRCKSCRLDELASVALRNGYPVTEQYLNDHNYTGQRIKTENVSTQLNLLAQQQVEAAVLLDFHLSGSAAPDYYARFERHHLKNYYSYHYVHKRHKDKVAPLLAILRDLERQGVVQQLRDKHGL